MLRRVSLSLAAIALLGASALALRCWQGCQTIKLPTGKTVTIPEKTLELSGRAKDLVLSPSGDTAYVKTDGGLDVVDLRSMKLVHSFGTGAGTSLTGIALSPDGKALALSDAGERVMLYRADEADVREDGAIKLPAASVGGAPYPCGMAFTTDAKSLLVCMSRDNSLATVDLGSKRVISRVAVGAAPFDVALQGQDAYVTCWAAAPRPGKLSADSGGTQVEIDPRGVASHGTICRVDLAAGKVVDHALVGLLPGKPLLESGEALFVDANSDLIERVSKAKLEVETRSPVGESTLPGASPNALCQLTDGRFAVACGGDDAVEIVGKDGQRLGEIRTPLYPIALAQRGDSLVVACAKGIGSTNRVHRRGKNVGDVPGALSVIPLSSMEPVAKPRPPRSRPLPAGIKHVIYVIKENRTYDQLFGDLTEGDPSFTTFGRDVTPNHHALAEQFGLLTRYFCDSVISTDGHAWSTEANSTAYLERSFGGWTRSYPWGDDPLSVTRSGAIWDDALDHGRSVRNYGEYVYATPTSAHGFKAIYNDWKAGKKLTFKPNNKTKRLWRVSDPKYPGWELSIPDQVRADEFVADFRSRPLSDLTIVYLDQDHTSGQASGMPTPRAMVADNDRALGRVVEAVTNSKYWASTAIFVIEDDPQDGYDHIDGHRSECLVVCPYTRGRGVVGTTYDQASVLRTIEAVLHLPPMTRFDATARVMSDCFLSKPDLRPFRALVNRIPLDEMNGAGHKSLKFDYPDESDDEALNRQIWASVFGTRPYPNNREADDR